MSAASPTSHAGGVLPRPWIGRGSAILRSRRALAILGAVVIAGGLAWRWDWLTAIGIAPILVALAPCAAMCALGLCVSRMGGRGSKTEANGMNRPTDAGALPSSHSINTTQSDRDLS